MALGPKTRKALRIAGYIYLVPAAAFILLGYASIVYFQGFAKLQEILSPFNVINFVAVVVTIAPGLLLLHFGREKATRL